MAELNLNQITDRLNSEFTGDTRKLVFWYDDKGEFAEELESLTLVNAKVHHLKPDNQFYTKYLLERKDTTTNYLIYAPFPKPDVKDNHLEDTLLYSKRFYADRASLLCADLGIEEKYKPLIETHIKFFGEKGRTQRFYDLEIENYNEENILIGLWSALCKTRTCSFEEVMRVVLTDGELTDNKYLVESDKYGLRPVFWKLCEQHFGYSDTKPTLEKLLATMFVTYTARYVHCELPAAWRSFISYKSGNIISFLDNLMNSVLYRDKYDELSAHIADSLKVNSVMQKIHPENIVDCDAFLILDSFIVDWIIDRLTSEDIGAKLNELSMMEVCDKRSRLHFGKRTRTTYELLRSACVLISAANYTCPDHFKDIIAQYCQSDCLLDYEYRKFYFNYDRLKNRDRFNELKALVENIYTNEYLAKQLPQWNAALREDEAMSAISLQRDFYKNYVKYTKDRTVVIISDALRYEVARELYQRLADDPKCTAKLDVQLGVLPSYTRLGMAALLPHKTLTMTDDFKVMADGVICDDLDGRQKVLRSHREKSRCVQFDDISSLTQVILRSVIPGNEVVYIYHNQIDARGDAPNTENEVFSACEEAIEELYDLIHALASRANTQHCVVTADHGFLYKRDKLAESDKIEGFDGADAFVNRRFIVSSRPVNMEGVSHISMGMVLDNDDGKYVSFPVGSSVFKVSGGGQNFVHGGSSPQEMLVPVMDVKTEKAYMAYTMVQIALVSMIRKITNLMLQGAIALCEGRNR